MTAKPIVPAEKATWRSSLIARRASLSPDDATEASLRAARRFIRDLPLSSPDAVALFWPLEGEIDTRPLLHALHALGVPTALPRIQGRDLPLRFHLWRPGDLLETGRFRVQQPTIEAPQVHPVIVVTPLLAFDSEGYRLGWGGGFYDRTFAALQDRPRPPARIGYAFACQQVDRVPREPFDQRLDMIVTEHASVHPG